ncbi:MAG: hypothetical protein HY314_10620 [Acidobacteria bacterium]|nr:hypothetical protein [Acidobacteriota bacterium]
MKAHYLTDTDWAIEYLKGRPEVVQRLDAARQDGLGVRVARLCPLLRKQWTKSN